MFKLNLAGFIMRDLSSGAVISRLCYLSQTREDVEGNPRWDSHYGSTARRPYWLCSAPAEAQDRVKKSKLATANREEKQNRGLWSQSFHHCLVLRETVKQNRRVEMSQTSTNAVTQWHYIKHPVQAWKTLLEWHIGDISTRMGLERHGEQMIIHFLSNQIFTMLVAVWK